LLEIAWQAGNIYGVAVLSAGVVSVTFLLVHALGRRLMPAPQAATGTLLLAGVYFFSWPLREFNHNMLQIPIWAAFFLVFHVCLEGARETTGRLRRFLPWVALGAIFALGLWTKYSSLLLAATGGIWLVANPRHRALLFTAGPWIAALVAAVLFAPHLAWLQAADWSPFTYFTARLDEGSTPLRFVLTQILHHLPALLLLLLAGLLRRWPGGVKFRALRETDVFLAVMALGPLVLTVLAALILGIRLRDMWGVPMFSLSGLLLVRAFARAANEARLEWLARYALILLCIVPVAYIAILFTASDIRKRPFRVNWPMGAIATEVSKICNKAIGRDPAVVVGSFYRGSQFLARVAALGLDLMPGKQRPQVLLFASLAQSPWIDVQRMREGTAFLWQMSGRDGTVPESLKPLVAHIASPPFHVPITDIPWPRMGKGPGLHFATLCVAASPARSEGEGRQGGRRVSN
jgi:hypothetical protein